MVLAAVIAPYLLIIPYFSLADKPTHSLELHAQGRRLVQSIPSVLLVPAAWMSGWKSRGLVGAVGIEIGVKWCQIPGESEIERQSPPAVRYAAKYVAHMSAERVPGVRRHHKGPAFPDVTLTGFEDKFSRRSGRQSGKLNYVSTLTIWPGRTDSICARQAGTSPNNSASRFDFASKRQLRCFDRLGSVGIRCLGPP